MSLFVSLRLTLKKKKRLTRSAGSWRAWGKHHRDEDQTLKIKKVVTGRAQVGISPCQLKCVPEKAQRTRFEEFDRLWDKCKILEKSIWKILEGNVNLNSSFWKREERKGRNPFLVPQFWHSEIPTKLLWEEWLKSWTSIACLLRKTKSYMDQRPRTAQCLQKSMSSATQSNGQNLRVVNIVPII